MPTIAEKYAATLRVVEDAEDSESQEISEDGEKRLVLEWNEIRRRSTVRVRKGIHRYTFSDRPAVLAPASIEVLWSLPHPGCTLRVLLDRGRPVAPEASEAPMAEGMEAPLNRKSRSSEPLGRQLDEMKGWAEDRAVCGLDSHVLMEGR